MNSENTAVFVVQKKKNLKRTNIRENHLHIAAV